MGLQKVSLIPCSPGTDELAGPGHFVALLLSCSKSEHVDMLATTWCSFAVWKNTTWIWIPAKTADQTFPLADCSATCHYQSWVTVSQWTNRWSIYGRWACIAACCYHSSKYFCVDHFQLSVYCLLKSRVPQQTALMLSLPSYFETSVSLTNL